MRLKKFAIDQKVTFVNRDHQMQKFVRGEGTVEKLLKDCYGHQFAEIKEVFEVDGGVKVKSHTVPVAGLDLKGDALAKYERCVLRYEEADQKYRLIERARFEGLINKIFNKATELLISKFKKSQAKRVAEYNRKLATLRRNAFGKPAVEFKQFPLDVVEAAIDGEVKQVVNDKIDQELDKA